MKIIIFLVATFLSFFSTAVMSYVSMAIPIGPWIAPTLALFAIIIFKVFSKFVSNGSQEMILVTVAGSVGGILATALGFYFTTLYFVDPITFNSFMESPRYFIFVVGFLSLTAGMFGILVANIVEHKLIVADKLAFPVGELVYKTISAYKSVKKSIELLIGFLATGLFCVLQDGLWKINGFIPRALTLFSKTTYSIFTIPAVRLDFWPMLWALGFVTGHVVALPLAVGVLSKILLIQPIYVLAFKDLTWMEYIITFCSGIVLSTAIFGFIKTPQSLFKSARGIFKKDLTVAKSSNKNFNLLEMMLVFFLFFSFTDYFKFSFLSKTFVLIFSFICAYQLAIIAGKIGLAPMGKFATFVMVPAMFIFPLNYTQIVLVATFVGICGGVACDVLFGRKIAHMANIPVDTIKKYQYLGLIVSAAFAGVVFWFLINHFQLGSDQLFALRAQNRWMLINTLKNSKTLNYYVLILGTIFGLILSKVKVSPLLVLGGLFMPINITLGLVIGGIGALFVKDKQEWYPFWSGVYASNSIWMLIKAIL